ncbi:hypothetical protein B0T25DRAFT_553876, partial [Lasiosphaeria hispida]
MQSIIATKLGTMSKTTPTSQRSARPYGLLLSFLLIFAFFGAALPSSAKCWFPDGNPAADASECMLQGTAVPTGTGLCCHTGDTCFSGAVCGWTPDDNRGNWTFYRGACTDTTWGGAQCPNFCLTETDNSIGNFYCTISPCADKENFQTCDHTDSDDYSTPRICKGR